LFAETPTAGDLARSVDETDRKARCVAAAFERNIRPEHLRGHGVRLVPTGQDLRVERALPWPPRLEGVRGQSRRGVPSASSEAAWALGRRPDRTYLHRTFTLPLRTSRDYGQPARYVVKVFDETPARSTSIDLDWEEAVIHTTRREDVSRSSYR
jgi:hypothetical protein